MKKILFFLFVITFSLQSFSQTYFFDVKQTEFKNYRNHEKKINSVVYPNRGQYMNMNLCQPIIYRRTNTKNNPNPIVMYYFTPKDSIVRRIYVEIDSLYYLPQDYPSISGYQENPSRLKYFDAQYEIMRQELITRFGNPNESQSLIKKENFYNRTDKWENDSLEINVSLIFAGLTNSANHIRATVDFKTTKIMICQIQIHLNQM